MNQIKSTIIPCVLLLVLTGNFLHAAEKNTSIKNNQQSAKIQQEPSKAEDKQIVTDIRKFFSANKIIWDKYSANYTDIIPELTALYSKYCTRSLTNKLEKFYKNCGLEYDIFVGAVFPLGDESISTLIIKQDPNKRNEYIISFYYTGENPMGETVREQSVVRYTMQKVGDKYKINHVISQ